MRLIILVQIKYDKVRWYYIIIIILKMAHPIPTGLALYIGPYLSTFSLALVMSHNIRYL